MERHVARSAGLVSAALFLSRITGLVREMVMARLFGAGAVYDAFALAFRIPNLARDLFAEGALSSAFVPVFTRSLAGGSRREAVVLAQLVSTALLLAVGAISLAGMIFSPQLVALLAPGFAEVPGKFELAVKLTRIMFPFLVLVALAAQSMGVLNALGSFGLPALASAVFNIVSVSLGLALAWGMEPIEAMSWGVVLGGLAQFLWQLPGVLRAGFPFRFRVDWSHPGLRTIMKLMVPAVLGGAAVQINVTVNTNFASSITDAAGQVIDGPVSWLQYAFRFMQLPIGLFGVAIASATLPELARSAGRQQFDEFRRTLSRSLGMTLLLTVPSSVGLAVLGESMIAAVYEGGRFGPADTRQTALALSGYAVGLAGYALIKVLAPALYALEDARGPMLVSLATVLVNLAVAFTAVRVLGLGHVGLALSTSANALFGAAVLAAMVRSRIGGIDGRALASSAVKIAVASAVMGLVCIASSRGILGALGASRAAHLADSLISSAVGALVFLSLCRVLRVRELGPAWAACAVWRAKIS